MKNAWKQETVNFQLSTINSKNVSRETMRNEGACYAEGRTN